MPFASVNQRDQLNDKEQLALGGKRKPPATGRVKITYAESKGPDVSRSIPWHADQNFGASPQRSAYAIAFFGKLGVYLRVRA